METIQTNNAIAVDGMASLDFVPVIDTAEAGTVYDRFLPVRVLVNPPVEYANDEEFDPAFPNHCTQSPPFTALSCNVAMSVELAHECCDSILNSANQASACRYLLGVLNSLSGDDEIAKATRRGAAAALIDVLMLGIAAAKAHQFMPDCLEEWPIIPSKAYFSPHDSFSRDHVPPVKNSVIRGNRFDSGIASALASRQLGRISWMLAVCLFVADVVVVAVARML